MPVRHFDFAGRDKVRINSTARVEGEAPTVRSLKIGQLDHFDGCARVAFGFAGRAYIELAARAPGESREIEREHAEQQHRERGDADDERQIFFHRK
jgi:hypothetical protein